MSNYIIISASECLLRAVILPALDKGPAAATELPPLGWETDVLHTAFISSASPPAQSCHR